MDKNARLVDGRLVTDFQSGNKQALVALVKRWHKTFCDKAYWMVKDPDKAKDIAQDCWQVIIDKLHTLNNPENFGAWAMRIVYTRSIDALNASNRMNVVRKQLKHEQDDIEDQESSQLDAIKQELLKTVNTLPNQQQKVIRLFYVQDYSLKDISSMLGISVGTVKSRLYHGREKLKTIIKNRNYEN
ncbi:RNA polymerase sigma factor [Flagellimonas sp.]|uniref:RNA polymerase sigma factor n=1 Tax=Flagellimonas sp. TaxID=2058762 RepID=UPI003B5136A4